MDWLSGLPSAALVVLVTPVILVLLARAEHVPVAVDATGWFSLRPSLASMVLGALTVLMSAFFLFGATSVQSPGRIAFFSAAAVLSALWGLYILNGVRMRFNADGVEYKGWFSEISVRWDEIEMVEYHPLLGPRFLTKKGSFPAPGYAYGFKQLLDEVVKRGIKVPKAFRQM